VTDQGWQAIVAAGIAALMPVQASAQAAYPVKPVRFITPTGAGGSLDWMTRLLAQRLSETWRKQFIVDNRVLQGAETREAFRQQGFEILGSTPEHFAEFVKGEIAKWTRVVQDAGLGAQ